MRIYKFRKIISISIAIILLATQVPTAYALYSPRLNNEASVIKQHIFDTRKAHGTGKWMDVLDKAKKEAAEGKGPAPNEGGQNLYWTAIKEMASDALTDNFWDGLSLLFKSWIDPLTTKKGMTNCLRDDIWELQALKEQVVNELMKASMMSDYYRSDILKKDYDFLEYRITGGSMDTDGDGFKEEILGLKNDASALDANNKPYFFPNSQNFYVDCPYGDFIQAWEDIKRALEAFKAIGSGTIELGSFGKMAKVAEARAKKRAQQWIKANQITVTIGGKEGSSPRSLVNGPGLKGLAADFKTEMSYAKNYAGEVYTNTRDAFLGLAWTDEELDKWNQLQLDEERARREGKSIDIGSYAAAYEQAINAKEAALKQMETTIKFNLSLTSVAENSLVAIDRVLFETNGIIKDAVSMETIDQNLQSFCKEFSTVIRIQCKNKNGEAPSCN